MNTFIHATREETNNKKQNKEDSTAVIPTACAVFLMLLYEPEEVLYNLLYVKSGLVAQDFDL